MSLRKGPSVQPLVTYFSTSLLRLFQMFSILFKSLILSSCPIIPLFNQGIKSQPRCHPTCRLDPSCMYSLLRLIPDCSPSLHYAAPPFPLFPLPSLPSGFLIIVDSDSQGSFRSVPFALFPQGYAISFLLTSLSDVWPIHFPPPLPEYLL